MDRIALSKRLEGFSQVFADGTPMARDLKAMSYVLANMSDEKFANVVNANWGAGMPEEDKDAFVIPGAGRSRVPQMMQQRRQRQERLEGMPDTPVFEPRDPKAALQALMANPAVQQAIQSDPKLKGLINPGQPKMATEEDAESDTGGGYWNREASTAVMAALVEDVMGKEAMEKSVCCDTNMHLTKDQTPDGEHKQETPASLKPEQTPHIDESLDSDIVAESKKTSLKKEAGSIKGPGKPDGTGPMSGTNKCPMSKKDDEEEDKDAAKKNSGLEELKEEKAEKAEEKAEKLEDDAKEDAGEAKKKLEKAEEVEEKAEELEDKDDDKDEMPIESKSKKKEATKEEEEPVLASEGVELVPPMQEIELSEDEAAKLSALFSE